MSWPPPTLPTNRTNANPQQDTHPADHNAANLAINDITAHIRGEKIVRGGRLDIANDPSNGLFVIRFPDLVFDAVVISLISPGDAYATYSGNFEGAGPGQASAYYFWVHYYSGLLLGPGASCAIHYVASGTKY